MDGPCSRCGQPGFLQGAPGAPYSAIFCDACAAKVARYNRIAPFGCLLVIAAIVAVVIFLIRRC